MNNPFKKPGELQVSEAVRRLNPHLFAAGQVDAEKSQPKARPALGREPQGRQQGERRTRPGAPLFRVSLVSLRRRRLDRDNLVGGFKPLRDSLARFIGVDDSEEFIEWEYDQLETRGEQETLVRIEIL